MLERSVISATAADQLGGWRWFVRAEPRALPRFFGEGERIERMLSCSLSWWTDVLLVATDRRLVVVHKPGWRRPRCTTIAYEDIEEVCVSPGRLVPELTVVSQTATRRLLPLNSEGVEPFANVLAARTAVKHVAEVSPADAVADGGVVSFGWRGPGSMAVVAWLSALPAGLLGVVSMWCAPRFDRVALKALRTWDPFGGRGPADIAEAVQTLDTMHRATTEAATASASSAEISSRS